MIRRNIVLFIQDNWMEDSENMELFSKFIWFHDHQSIDDVSRIVISPLLNPSKEQPKAKKKNH